MVCGGPGTLCVHVCVLWLVLRAFVVATRVEMVVGAVCACRCGVVVAWLEVAEYGNHHCDGPSAQIRQKSMSA